MCLTADSILPATNEKGLAMRITAGAVLSVMCAIAVLTTSALAQSPSSESSDHVVGTTTTNQARDATLPSLTVPSFLGARASTKDALTAPPDTYAFPDNMQPPLPAVDGLNARLSPSVGWSSSGDHSKVLSGLVAMPLGHQFGLQIDGGVIEADTEEFGDLPIYGIAPHLFWRDPSVGMFGVVGAWTHVDRYGGIDLFGGAVEGALYFDRLSIDAMAGAVDGDYLDADFAGSLELSYYATDDLRLHIGPHVSFGDASLHGGVEWLALRNDRQATSLYVNGTVGDDGASSVHAGVNLYFGQKDKSLIRRNREDDPPDRHASLGVSAILLFYFLSAQHTVRHIIKLAKFCSAADRIPNGIEC